MTFVIHQLSGWKLETLPHIDFPKRFSYLERSDSKILTTLF